MLVNNMQDTETKIEIPEYDVKSIYPNKKRLSSTQFLDYEEDPEAFYLSWVMGIRKPPTVPMQIGSVFSAKYADRSLDADSCLKQLECKPDFIKMFNTAVTRLPVLKGGHPEYPLVCEYRGWEFRATLDDYVGASFVVIENKTGQVEWDQDRANSSDQVTFQAWCHWVKYGVAPSKIILNWWNTKQKNFCDVRSFKTSRSVKYLKQFQERVDVVIDNLNAENFTKKIYE